MNAAPTPVTVPVRLAAALVGGACIVAPLALGATPSGARLALETVVVLVVICWASGRTAAGPGMGLVPILVAAALTLQVVPLPLPLLDALAPLPAELWRREGATDADWRTVSVDPAATAAGIRRLLLGLSVLVVVADLGRRPDVRRWLAATLAVSGTTILILGLTIRSSRDDRMILRCIDLSGPILFWKTPVHEPVETAGCAEPDWVTLAGERYLADGWIVGDRVGPYVVSNHFVGGLELTLPFAAALLVGVRRLPRPLGGVLAAGLAAAALAAAWGVARSRAGAAALVLALVVLVAGLAPRGWPRRIAAIVAAAAGTAIAVFEILFVTRGAWVVTWLPVEWRPSAWGLLHDSRVVLGAIAMRLFRESPLLGTGLGTYGDTSQRLLGGAVATHFTHDDWAQWMAETGLVGILAGLACLVAFLRSRPARDPAVPRATPAIDAAAWAAVAGIAVHSLHDWNLHVPANAFLAAVAAGLALSSGPPRGEAPCPEGDGFAARIARGGPALLAGACLLALAVLVRDAWADGQRRELRGSLAQARLAIADGDRPDPQPALHRGLARGAAAVRLDPGDARLEVLQGQIGLHLATLADTPAAARRLRAEAEDHFTRARRLSAVCRGLPEKAPPPRPRRPRTP